MIRLEAGYQKLVPYTENTSPHLVSANKRPHLLWFKKVCTYFQSVSGSVRKLLTLHQCHLINIHEHAYSFTAVNFHRRSPSHSVRLGRCDGCTPPVKVIWRNGSFVNRRRLWRIEIRLYGTKTCIWNLWFFIYEIQLWLFIWIAQFKCILSFEHLSNCRNFERMSWTFMLNVASFIHHDIDQLPTVKIKGSSKHYSSWHEGL